MRITLLKKILILSFVMTVFLSFFLLVFAEDQLVPYGITRSKDGQYIPVFDSINSNNKIDMLIPDQICALDFAEIVGKYYWYHIVYYSDTGEEKAGYVKEGNFEQFTVSRLSEVMTDPDIAMLISRFIALRDKSPLFLGETGLNKRITTTGKKQNETTYILNTNTHKFHYPSCKSVKQMKEKNKKTYIGTREKIIEMGYSPCKNCNP